MHKMQVQKRGIENKLPENCRMMHILIIRVWVIKLVIPPSLAEGIYVHIIYG